MDEIEDDLLLIVSRPCCPREMSYQEFTFIKTTYDISLDSQISLLPLGFSLLWVRRNKEIGYEDETFLISPSTTSSPTMIDPQLVMSAFLLVDQSMGDRR